MSVSTVNKFSRYFLLNLSVMIFLSVKIFQISEARHLLLFDRTQWVLTSILVLFSLNFAISCLWSERFLVVGFFKFPRTVLWFLPLSYFFTTLLGGIVILQLSISLFGRTYLINLLGLTIFQTQLFFQMVFLMLCINSFVSLLFSYYLESVIVKEFPSNTLKKHQFFIESLKGFSRTILALLLVILLLITILIWRFPDSLNFLMVRAVERYYRHDMSVIYQVYDLFLEKFPDSSLSKNILYRKANSLKRSQLADEAFKHYQILYQNYSDSMWAPESLYQMALIRREQQRLEEAVVHYNQYLYDYPLGYLADDCLLELAEIHLLNSNLPEAINCLERVITDYSESSKILFYPDGRFDRKLSSLNLAENRLNEIGVLDEVYK